MDTSKTILFRVGPFPKLSETFIMSQIEGLVDLGFTVNVLADNRCEDIDLIKSEVIKKIAKDNTTYLEDDHSLIHKVVGILPYRLKSAIKGFREKNAYKLNDVILCHFGWMGVEASKHLKKMDYKGKLFTIFHGADMSTYLKEFGGNPYSELFEIGHRFLPISQFWKAKLIELGAPENRIILHRMGVIPSAFSFSPRDTENVETFEFISVGRLAEKKGTEFTIRALKQMQTNKPFKLTLIGNGPLEKQIKELAKDLNVEHLIEFTGSLSHTEVAQRLKQANAFVLPSVVASNGDMEGIPVALMEAMASGLPVISTKHSGIPELVKHEETGLLTEEKNVNELAAAMLQTMTEPEATAKRAIAARTLVETDFNNEIWNQRLATTLSAT